jgi:hypothetical protein
MSSSEQVYVVLCFFSIRFHVFIFFFYYSQTQSEVAQQKAPKLEVKSEIPEKPPASETKKWSFFGCKTPDVPKPEIKVPTLKRKSSEEKIETPRETITPTNNISINNETIIPPKLTRYREFWLHRDLFA